MHSEAEKVVEAAMEGTFHSRAMRDIRKKMADKAREIAPDQVASLEAESAEYGQNYGGALRVLAHVLEALGYDVHEPIGKDNDPSLSIKKAEAELEKWMAAQSEKPKQEASA